MLPIAVRLLIHRSCVSFLWNGKFSIILKCSVSALVEIRTLQCKQWETDTSSHHGYCQTAVARCSRRRNWQKCFYGRINCTRNSESFLQLRYVKLGVQSTDQSECNRKFPSVYLLILKPSCPTYFYSFITNYSRARHMLDSSIAIVDPRQLCTCPASGHLGTRVAPPFLKTALRYSSRLYSVTRDCTKTISFIVLHTALLSFGNVFATSTKNWNIANDKAYN